MAFKHGKGIYVGLGTVGAPNTAVDVSNKLTGLTATFTRDVAEATTIRPTGGAKVFVGGLNDETFSCDFRFEAAIFTQLYDAMLSDDPVILVHGPHGNASGAIRMSCQVFITNVTPGGGIGDVVGGSVSWQRTGQTTVDTFA